MWPRHKYEGFFSDLSKTTAIAGENESLFQERRIQNDRRLFS